MDRFAKILKELRVENNMSRKDLAGFLNVNIRTIGYWETGERECNLDQLCCIAKLFGVTTDYLLGLEI